MRSLCISALLSVLLIVSFAQADVTLSFPNLAACQGDVGCVPVYISSVTGQGIVAFACSVRFDPTVVNVVSPVYELSGSLTAGWTVFDTVNNAAGWLQIGGFSTSPLVGQGLLLCLYFQVLPGAPGGAVSSLIFASFEFNEGTPAAITQNGSISVLYPAPDQVTATVASNDLCDRIVILWTPVAHTWQYQIKRDDVLFASVDSDVTQFTDWSASVGTHQYKVRAVNVCGEGPYSPPATGTRLTIPAAPGNVQASDTLCASVWITWQDVETETAYEVLRDGGVLSGQLPANTTSYQDLTAVPGTIYLYDVSAINQCGAAANGNYGQRRAVPAQPATVVASDSLCDRVTVSWNAQADVDSFQIRRNGTRIGGVTGGVFQYADMTVSAWARYAYTVVAYNTCGTSSPSLPDSGGRMDIPAVPTAVAASTDRCDSIIITWVDPPGAQLLQVVPVPGSQICVLPPGVMRCADRPLPGTRMYYVRAWNTCGWGEPSNSVTGARLDVPPQVAGVNASNTFCDYVEVTWANVVGEDSFQIRRAGSRVGSVPADVTLFRDSTATPFELSPYEVVAYNRCGAGPVSAPEDGLAQSAPPPVTGLAATTNRCDSIIVTWNDVPNIETFYRLYRDGVQIYQPSANEARFADAPAPGSYSYQVLGGNDCGDGPLSTAVTGTRLALPAQVTGVSATDNRCDSVIVTWTDLATETYYRVYRDGNAVGFPLENQTRFADAPPAGSYSYQVLAGNTCGDGPPSTSVTGTRLGPPAQVTGVSATDNRCDSVIVTWNDVAEETLYRIFRNSAEIGSVAANVTRYADAPPAGTYSYGVRAENTCGNATPSVPDSGTRLLYPGMPSGVTASDNQCGRITVSWFSGGGDVDSFKVFRNGSQVGGVSGGTLMFTDSVTGTYAYTVRGFSNECLDGPMSAPDSGRGRATAGTPTGLNTMTPFTCDSIRLLWTAASGDVAQYYVYRDGALADSTTVTHYTDRGLDDPNEHVYRVAAMNPACGMGELSSPATGHERSLVELLSAVSDTIPCSTSVHVQLAHCATVQQDSFFLSLSGGPFAPVWTESPPLSDAWVPVFNSGPARPNSRLMIVGIRGSRRDTLISNPFFLDSCITPADNFTGGGIPDRLYLDPNFPNPFNPSTVIRFGVPQAAEVRIDVFDVLGRRIATPVTGTWPPGVHAITWDCRACPSGMYLVRMQSGSQVFTGKMLLMK